MLLYLITGLRLLTLALLGVFYVRQIKNLVSKERAAELESTRRALFFLNTSIVVESMLFFGFDIYRIVQGISIDTPSPLIILWLALRLLLLYAVILLFRLLYEK
jgi:hypothetical protein